jgi:hypothetical protein
VFGQANQLSRQNIRPRDRQAPERNALSGHRGLHQRVRVGKGGACDITIKLQASGEGFPRWVFNPWRTFYTKIRIAYVCSTIFEEDAFLAQSAPPDSPPGGAESFQTRPQRLRSEDGKDRSTI